MSLGLTIIIFFSLNFLFLFKYLKKPSSNLFQLILTSLLISITVLSLLILFMYYLNLYTTTNLLWFLVVVNSFLIFFIFKKRESLHKQYLEKEIIDRYDLMFLLILFLVTIITSHVSYFGILTDTDSFNYLSEGLTIGKNINYGLPPYSLFNQPYKITSSLPLFPLWISLFGSLFGNRNVFYINMFFSNIALIAMYLFLSENLGKKIALISIFSLSLNLSWLLTSKTLLREPAAVNFIFTWLLFTSNYKNLQFLAPFILFLAFQLRPEFLAIIPFLTILIYLRKIHYRKYIIEYVLPAALFLLMSVRVNPGRYTSPLFVANIMSKWWSLITQKASIISIVILMIIPLTLFIFKNRTRLNLDKRRVTIVLIFILFLIGVFIRPISFYSHYTSNFDITKIINTDIVNFDDISLLRLGYFIPIPVVLLSILGFNLYLINNRKETSLSTFIIVWIMMSLVFFINPFHEPNIRIWIRRFIPVVIPGVFIFFSYWIIKADLPRKFRIAIFSFVLVLNLVISLPNAIFQEYNDLYMQLENFSKRFRSEDMIVFYYPKDLLSDYKIAGILSIIFNKNTYITSSPNINFQNNNHNRNVFYFVTFDSSNINTNCPLVDQEQLSLTRFTWEYFSVPNILTKISIPLTVYKCIRT